mgnify:CR=1 FL=1
MSFMKSKATWSQYSAYTIPPKTGRATGNAPTLAASGQMNAGFGYYPAIISPKKELPALNIISPEMIKERLGAGSTIPPIKPYDLVQGAAW